MDLNQRHSKEKQRIMDEFSGLKSDMESMLNMKSSKMKEEMARGQQKKPMDEYLMNFSNAAAVFNVS